MFCYFLGIGSNLEPEKHIILILDILLEKYQAGWVSRIIQTEPVGMSSDNYFLNLILAIQSDEDEITLKTYTNNLEAQLGRNRNDPQSKTKDRTADIDILFRLVDEKVTLEMLPPESYLRDITKELVGFMELGHFELDAPLGEGIQLDFHGYVIGETPMQLHPQV